jgi:AraC-like DNA-binding protein
VGAPRDPISRALGLVTVSSTVLFRVLFRAPWGVSLDTHFGPAFHLVTSGKCVLEVDGHPAWLQLSSGDLVILPNGRPHSISCDLGAPTASLEELVACSAPGPSGVSPVGGDGTATFMVCGGFTLDPGAPPVSTLLPPVIHIRGSGGRPVPWVDAMIDLLATEGASDAPGAQIVANHLADVLLTQALRVSLLEANPDATNAMSTLRDPAIRRAVALIHGDPQHPWTVGSLAHEVALSRSAFASRFRELVGDSPKSYITRTRLAEAAATLHTTDATLTAIARQAGYASQFSFSSAFKRVFGVAPSAYRRQRSQHTDDHDTATVSS